VRSPLVPLIIGIAFLSGAVYAGAERRRTHEADVRDILALRRELDSTRAALHRAASVADSVRLAVNSTSRRAPRRSHCGGRRRVLELSSRRSVRCSYSQRTSPGGIP
jgi:hypothetical protein